MPETTDTVPKIVLNRAEGTIRTVGDIVLRPATVTCAGITVAIGDGAIPDPSAPGLIHRPAGTPVNELVGGLRAAGAQVEEVVTILQTLRQVGALSADLEIQ